MALQQAERQGAMQQQQMRMTGAMQQQQMQMQGAAQTQAMQLAGASEQQRLVLQGAAQAQAYQVGRENLVAQGAGAADLQERAGEAMLQEAEMSRQSTLLGIQYGQSAGANAAYQQALLNQQQANASANQMTTTALSSLSNIDWSGVNNPFTNDLGQGDSFY